MKIMTSLALLLSTTAAFAHDGPHGPCCDDWRNERPDGHAPIGVMGDHTHHAGGWMASYRYMFMNMQQTFVGDSVVADSTGGFMMSPTSMDMEMHMVGLMYSPSDDLTLMLMSNYVENSMEMVANMGMMAGTTSQMESNGWGDTSFTALYKFFNAEKSRAHFGLGLSAPTGSIGEKLPNGLNQPYAMQLGSGTWDIKPSLTYLVQPSDTWSWGAQANATIRLGRNHHSYSLGNQASATAWIARNVTNWASTSFRITGTTWGNVDGQDTEMLMMGMTAMASPAVASNRGGSRIDAAVGMNLWNSDSGFRFGVEASKSLYQKLDGPQLGNDWSVTLGAKYTW